MTTPLLLLLFPLIALGGATPRAVEESLSIDNGLDRGEWGPPDTCPAGSWAFAFEIKYASVGYADDTCVNAIKLYCMDASGALTDTTISTEGTWGQWKGMRTCPGGHFLTGLRANVVPDMGTFGDDLGMDNLQMFCSDNSVLDGLHGTPLADRDGQVVAHTRDLTMIGEREVERVHYKIRVSELTREYGDWGSWVYCSDGLRVCGHESKVEPESVLNDDAGLVDVIMFCCSVN